MDAGVLDELRGDLGRSEPEAVYGATVDHAGGRPLRARRLLRIGGPDGARNVLGRVVGVPAAVVAARRVGQAVAVVVDAVATLRLPPIPVAGDRPVARPAPEVERDGVRHGSQVAVREVP